MSSMTERLERVHLRLLREVEQSGSLTAAAKRMGLTQSALSHTVRRLEDQLGTEVWVREGRGLRLTPVGRYLLSVSERLLPQFAHAEHIVDQFARGERGTLRVGMECHPCYRWLLQIVGPFLRAWPDVDLDVRQKFQFGGIAALFGHEIDLLVTPDPLRKKGLEFVPVFPYEHVLVVPGDHPLASKDYVLPPDLAEETLITYPVEPERLDIYSHFFFPAETAPRRQQIIETTDILLQMVACGRGVAALPDWLVREYQAQLDIAPVRLGRRGIKKQLFVGVRRGEAKVDFLADFIRLAKNNPPPARRPRKPKARSPHKGAARPGRAR